MTIMALFGLGNVMHAGLICLPNGEHGKIVKKNTLKIGEAVRMQHVVIIMSAFSEARGYLPKFNTGRLRPEVQPLTLVYNILAENAPL